MDTPKVIDIATRRVAPAPDLPDARTVILAYFMEHGPIHIPASFIETEWPPWDVAFVPVTDGVVFKIDDAEPAQPTPIRPMEEPQ